MNSSVTVLIHFQKIQPKDIKTVFLLGDLNVDLLKYEQNKATNEFLDTLSSIMFLPYIIQPTRITFHSKSIIDNIFSNYISQEIISGNKHQPYQITCLNFLSHPIFFEMLPTKNPTFLNGTGQNSTMKSSFLIILQQIGPIF